MKLKVFFFLLLGVPSTLKLYAQQNPPIYQYELENAERAYLSKKYNTAANLYKKVFPKIKNEELRQKVLFNIAESYRLGNNYKQAFKWFEETINAKYPDPIILYSYGNLLKYFERYEDAQRTFSDYLFEMPNDEKGKIALNSCNIAQNWKANPEKFTISNIKSWNTEFADYSPYFSNGKVFWTSSRKESTGNLVFEWTGQKMSDLFYANYNETYDKPINLQGKINTNYNDGTACLDSSENVLYFTQCNGINGKGINCKIYVSYKKNNTWDEPTMLNFNSDSFSCGTPSISQDGKRLFFASDMPGGYGEKDIYVSHFDEIKAMWQTPRNLGKSINTPDDDMFPYIDENNVLYYSTKGKIGLGGFDIFKTEDSANTYKEPINLKFPINSGGDDFGITFMPKNKQKPLQPIAFFTSNRQDGLGDDDLYSITIKPFVFYVKGKVLDAEGNQPIGKSVVSLTNNAGKLLFSVNTTENGEFNGEVPFNSIQTLLANKTGYFASTPIEINSQGLTNDSLLELTLRLTPIPAPEVDFTLQGILYDLDKFDLRAESKVVLDSLAVILKNNPNLSIEIGSHTDSRAPADYNVELSKKRAQSCLNYLISKGIKKERLVAVGYGESKLLNDCSDGIDCSEEEHQLNRRTTFRVLNTEFKR